MSPYERPPGPTRALRQSHCRSSNVHALVTQPGRLYGARLVSADPAGATAAVGCILYDNASEASGDVVLALSTSTDAGSASPDDWPSVALSLGFLRGLYPVFTVGDAFVLVFWERD